MAKHIRPGGRIHKEFYQGAMMLIGHPCSPRELAGFTRTNVKTVKLRLKELLEDGSVGNGMSVADSRKTLYYLKEQMNGATRIT